MLKLLPQSHDSVFLSEQSVEAIFGLYKATGSGCTTEVEHMPHDREVMGLNPTECWAFFSSLSYQQCP